MFAVHQSVSSLRLSRHLSPPPVTCKHRRRKLARKQYFVRKGLAALNMHQSQLEISALPRQQKETETGIHLENWAGFLTLIYANNERSLR